MSVGSGAFPPLGLGAPPCANAETAERARMTSAKDAAAAKLFGADMGDSWGQSVLRQVVETRDHYREECATLSRSPGVRQNRKRSKELCVDRHPWLQRSAHGWFADSCELGWLSLLQAF